jgi:aspartate/glutamate racemase
VVNERIRKLAISKGIYDSLCDPYDSHKNGDYYSSVMDDLERFAKLIIQECSELTLDHKNDDYYNGWLDYRDEIKKHFEVE